MKTLIYILAVVALAFDANAQKQLREATAAEVTAGTMGLPAVLTPRRAAGLGGGNTNALTAAQAARLAAAATNTVQTVKGLVGTGWGPGYNTEFNTFLYPISGTNPTNYTDAANTVAIMYMNIGAGSFYYSSNRFGMIGRQIADNGYVCDLGVNSLDPTETGSWETFGTATPGNFAWTNLTVTNLNVPRTIDFTNIGSGSIANLVKSRQQLYSGIVTFPEPTAYAMTTFNGAPTNAIYLLYGTSPFDMKAKASPVFLGTNITIRDPHIVKWDNTNGIGPWIIVFNERAYYNFGAATNPTAGMGWLTSSNLAGPWAFQGYVQYSATNNGTVYGGANADQASPYPFVTKENKLKISISLSLTNSYTAAAVNFIADVCPTNLLLFTNIIPTKYAGSNITDRSTCVVLANNRYYLFSVNGEWVSDDCSSNSWTLVSCIGGIGEGPTLTYYQGRYLTFGTDSSGLSRYKQSWDLLGWSDYQKTPNLPISTINGGNIKEGNFITVSPLDIQPFINDTVQNGGTNLYQGAINKIYAALLTQTGTAAPVATVLQNTLGGNPVWVRNTTGIYKMTLTNAFGVSKTGMTIAVDDTVDLIPNAFVGRNAQINNNDVTIETTDATGTLTDNELLNTYIKVEVYP